MENKWRQFAALLLGAILGALGSLFYGYCIYYIRSHFWIICIALIFISVILILWALGKLAIIRERIIIWLRKDKLIPIKIGILNDIGWNKANKDWSDISPEEWITKIEVLAREKKRRRAKIPCLPAGRLPPNPLPFCPPERFKIHILKIKIRPRDFPRKKFGFYPAGRAIFKNTYFF